MVIVIAAILGVLIRSSRSAWALGGVFKSPHGRAQLRDGAHALEQSGAVGIWGNAQPG